MFSKPINIISLYLVIIINFLIITLPFFMAIFPFMEIEGKMVRINQYLVFNPKQMLMFLGFLVSGLMLIYLFFDFIFGFSISSLILDCTRYDKIKEYQFLESIFNEARDKFNLGSAKLYIKNSPEINAFAIGSLGRKVIIITDGLILHYLRNANNQEEFLMAIRSIIGHEMSHLINKDFFPGLLIMVNQKITNLVSSLLKRTFMMINNLLTIFFTKDHYSNNLINYLYKFTDQILNFFNSHIVHGLYNFLKKFASRSVEYRADRQSAQAFGGSNMAYALELLGDSGYFSLFSTHPTTIKRIKKLENIKEQSGIILPSILNLLFYYFSLLLLFLICLFCFEASGAGLLINEYLIPKFIFKNSLELFKF